MSLLSFMPIMASSTLAKLMTKGFIAGGAIDPTPTAIYAKIDKIPFASETLSSMTNALTTSRYCMAQASSLLNGYILGTTTVEALSFTTETSAAKTGTLASRVRSSSAQSSLKGYKVSGGAVANQAPLGIIDAIVFSTEVCSTLAATAPVPRRHATSLSSSTQGYAAGGVSISAPGFTSIDALVFATDTTAAKTQVLAQAKYAAAGHSFTYKGYVLGGISSSTVGLSTIETVDFSTDAVVSVGSALSVARGYATCVASTVVGIATGGYNNGALVNTTSKLTEATQTVSSLASTLGTARIAGSGLQV